MKKSTVYCTSSWFVVGLLALATLPAQGDSGAAPMAVAATPAAGPSSRVVKMDNVNIRSRPSTSAEVIAQLRKGAMIEVRELKMVSDSGKSREWVRIGLPETAKCYVNSNLLKDGVASTDNINIRCGPGTNFKDVGQLKKGEKVQVVKAAGEWTQIHPTENCTGWIAADLLETAQVTPPARPIISVPEVVTAPPVVTVAPPPTTIIETRTVEVEVHVDYVVRDGILQKVEGGAGYELATEEVERRQYRIAYLEVGSMDVAKYVGKHVRVVGNQRWRAGERYPVMVVERLDIVW
jgi:uncharacterized protein YgiM (DUF1202 family)